MRILDKIIPENADDIAGYYCNILWSTFTKSNQAQSKEREACICINFYCLKILERKVVKGADMCTGSIKYL
jgi:hypothetical protein